MFHTGSLSAKSCAAFALLVCVLNSAFLCFVLILLRGAGFSIVVIVSTVIQYYSRIHLSTLNCLRHHRTYYVVCFFCCSKNTLFTITDDFHWWRWGFVKLQDFSMTLMKIFYNFWCFYQDGQQRYNCTSSSFNDSQLIKVSSFFFCFFWVLTICENYTKLVVVEESKIV